MKSFAQKQAQRICRNTIIIWLIVIGALFAFHYVTSPNLKNMFLETAEVNTNLAELKKSRNTFVHANVQELFYTDYYQTKDNVTKAQYYAFWSGEQYVVVKTPAKMKEDTYENYDVNGTLKDCSKQIREWVATDVADGWEVDFEEAKDNVSPYMIDITDNRTSMRVWTIIGLLVMLLGLFEIVKSILNLANFAKMKSFKNLEKTLNIDPHQANSEITAELDGGKIVYATSVVKITDSFVIEINTTSYKVRKKSDIIWMYKKITKNYTNGIPSGKTYGLTLWFADRKTLDINITGEKNTDDALAILHANMPDVEIGYSEERKQELEQKK